MARLNEHFINSFVAEIGQISGTDFEYLCKPILYLIIKEEVLHKGHNLYCKPVGYTADFISDNYENDYILQGQSKNYGLWFHIPHTDFPASLGLKYNKFLSLIHI